MIEGKLHFGAFGIGGEIGHQTVAPEGPVCGCGNAGCLEAVTRPPVIAEAAGRETVEDFLDGLASGDPRCEEAMAAAAHYVGIGLGNILTVIGPERIVIGGGVSTTGDLVLDPIRKAVRRRVTLVPRSAVEIVAAELGPSAGAIGSALSTLGSTVGDTDFLEGEVPSAALRRGEGEQPSADQ